MGSKMDNLMDKLLQKYYSQEMIRANTEGEKEEKVALQRQIDVLQKQMQQYDECLQEMRELSSKNIENTQELNHLLKAVGSGFNEITTASGEELQKLSAQALEKMNSNLGQAAEINDDKIALACDQMIELSTAKVNLTANVGMEKLNQLTDEAMAKLREIEVHNQTPDFSGIFVKLEEIQTTAEKQISAIEEQKSIIEDQRSVIEGQKSAIEEQFKKSEDFAHKDHVKIYRNVQAVIVEETTKQTTELKESVNAVGGKNKSVLVFAVLAFIISLADLGFNLAKFFGLI